MRKKIFKVYGVLWLLSRLQKLKITEECLEKMGGWFEILKEKIPILETVDFSFGEEFFSGYPFVKNIWDGIYDFLGSSHSWVVLVLLYFLVRLNDKRMKKIGEFFENAKNFILKCRDFILKCRNFISKYRCEAELLKHITNVECLSLEHNIFLKLIDIKACMEETLDMVQIKECTYKGVKFYLSQEKIYWKTENLQDGNVIEANKEKEIKIGDDVLWVKVL